jgi:hypothetical protein
VCAVLTLQPARCQGSDLRRQAARAGLTPPALPYEHARVEQSTEESYEEIEGALRSALRGTTKAKPVRCPHCQESFKVNMPDFSAAISAGKLLLELVVSRPKPPEKPGPLDFSADVEMGEMSTRDLYRIAFPRP